MSSIDNRIVKMGFENAQFTKAANSTMNTLKKLGDSLKLTSASKGLENISAKAKSVDMSTLASGVDTVTSRFSAMDIVGVTALVNITNSAISAGTNLVKSLTIDPISMGFQEYETKMQSIQTILTNTAHAGTSLEDVTAALDDLNVYADKTIYNFAEMTRNIGTFTAAGVGLEDAKVAIKGIANLAAGSGSTSQQASTAMYQLSQALASGTVNLQDWNSVVNAGMGGKLFQDALKKTGKLMGANINEAQTFRESISAKDGTGWLTSEILLETLKQFAEDPALLQAATQVKTFTGLIDTMKESVQSGWSQSWEHIIGDKEEAAEFFTAVSDGFNGIMGPMADYRNEALKYWNESGGRLALINGMKNVMTAIGKILGPIYESFKKIIDPWNGARLTSLSEGFEWLTSKLIISDKASEGIGKTFDGLFSIIKTLASILKPVGALIGGVLTIATPLLGIIPRITGVVGGFVTKIADFINSFGLMDSAISGMTNTAEKVEEALTWLFDDSSSWLNQGIAQADEYIDKLSESMDGLLSVGREKFGKFSDQFKEVWNAVQPVEKAAEFLNNGLDAIKSGLDSFVKFAESSMDKIKKFFSELTQNIKDTGVEGIDVLNAGLFGGLILLVRKAIKMLKNFSSSVGPFKESAIGLLDDLRGTLEVYQKNLKSERLKNIAVAVALLATSIFILSNVQPERMKQAMIGMGVLLASVMGALFALTKIKHDKLKGSSKTVYAMIGIAIALNILATAMVKLGKLDTKQMITSIAGLVGASIAMAVLVKSLDKAKITPKQGIAIMGIATAMVILSAAFGLMALISPSKLLSGLASMGAAMLGIAIFLKCTKDVTNSARIAASMIPLATSMVVLAGALFLFGALSPSTLMQGFTVMAITLTMFGTFVKAMKGQTANMTQIAVGILIIANSMIVLSAALGILGNMKISTLAQGLIVMGVALGLLALGLRLMPNGGGMISNAIGILILSAALSSFALTMKLLGSLDVWTVAKGLLYLAGILSVLGAMSVLLAPSAMAMVAVAGGISVMAVAIALLGGAFLIATAGLSSFSAAILALGVSISGACGMMLMLFPALGVALALAIASFVTTLGYNAEPMGKAFAAILISLFEALSMITPSFLKWLGTLIEGICRLVIEKAPDIGVAIMSIISVMCKVLIDGLPMVCNLIMIIMKTLFKLILDFIPEAIGFIVQAIVLAIGTLLEELGKGCVEIGDKLVELFLVILDQVAENTVKLVNAFWDMGIKVIDGLAESFETKGPELNDAIKRLVKAMIKHLTDSISDFTEIGWDIVSGMAKGIKDSAYKVVDAAKSIASNALDTVKGWLGIHSPSREFAKLGKFSAEGMANGLSDYGSLVSDESEVIAEGALSSMRSAMSSVADLMNEEVNSQPTIRPILDISDVQNGVKNIDGLINKNRGIDATISAAGQVSAGLSRLKTSIGGGDSTTTNTENKTEITNHFNIKSDNPRDVADEVSRRLQMQLERKDAVWA